MFASVFFDQIDPPVTTEAAYNLKPVVDALMTWCPQERKTKDR